MTFRSQGLIERFLGAGRSVSRVVGIVFETLNRRTIRKLALPDVTMCRRFENLKAIKIESYLHVSCFISRIGVKAYNGFQTLPISLWFREDFCD
jgi:hypothetical protein